MVKIKHYLIIHNHHCYNQINIVINIISRINCIILCIINSIKFRCFVLYFTKILLIGNAICKDVNVLIKIHCFVVNFDVNIV
eukprot:UN10212